MVESTRHVPLGQGYWPSVLDSLKQMGTQIAEYFSPSADAAATAEAYEIDLELPGVEENDIDVTVNEHVLTVKGEKRSERDQEAREYFFSERSYGAFQRSFRLPNDANLDGIGAEFHNGVLTIVVPKLTASETARKVEIKRRG